MLCRQATHKSDDEIERKFARLLIVRFRTFKGACAFVGGKATDLHNANFKRIPQRLTFLILTYSEFILLLLYDENLTGHDVDEIKIFTASNKSHIIRKLAYSLTRKT